ncbi:hypothetical protein ACFQQB_18675 [Nonomuraea rubra]
MLGDAAAARGRAGGRPYALRRAAFGEPPVRGDVTRTEELAEYAGGAPAT